MCPASLRSVLARLLCTAALIVAPGAAAQHATPIPLTPVSPAALVVSVLEPSGSMSTTVDLASKVNESYWGAIEGSVVGALTSGTPEAKSWAMRRIIVESARPEAAGRFRQCVHELLSLFDSHRDPLVRLMAVSTLHSLQHAQSMEILNQLVDDERDRRVRRAALTVLSEYFALKYLEEQDERSEIEARRSADRNSTAYLRARSEG